MEQSDFFCVQGIERTISVINIKGLCRFLSLILLIFKLSIFCSSVLFFDLLKL